MKQWAGSCCITVHSRIMTRYAVIFLGLLCSIVASAQGDPQVRSKADALFKEERYAEAVPLYSQLISLDPSDHQLNFRYGTSLLQSGQGKEKAVGYLKYAVSTADIPVEAWYWLGRAYHLNYQFSAALDAYGKFQNKADKKMLAALPVNALEKQCRNGQKLLSKLKEIDVRKKVEVAEEEFFRYYDLSDIGGKIVVLPEELKSSLDKKKKERSLIYLPGSSGHPIYFSSYGKDGKTGKDIYRTELLPTGGFATPVKVPGYINTDEDEDHPFLHPDGKTFYFSSKGHNSMGGYDVFKAIYDRRSDVFGPPENMDFAVNTPDDDFLYIVDPEHTEACFASARSSGQGKVHVYRVSTSQIPLVITVLKGGYVNETDAADKKARIVVEDAVSRQVVTEVRTADDGSYVLALPRSGRYRFLVECGPGKKTHVGMVDVPRSDAPQAFRQELALTRSGDQEKLVIRNLFDEPLEGDLIALALEEIKRRARLDVNERPVEAPVVEEHFDMLTRAGFTGEYDLASVQRLADNDARELGVKADDLKAQSKKAYAMALKEIKEAEDLAHRAQDLSNEAVLLSGENERSALMLEAAVLRDDSRHAAIRARTAHRTAQDLDDRATTLRQEALSAEKLAEDIRRTVGADKQDEAVGHLSKLKQRLDLKARPDHDPDPVFLAERAMLEKEKQAKSAVQRANSARSEEEEVAARITQLEREKSTTKNARRAEEIDRELTTLRESAGHLAEEVKMKFKAAAEVDEELMILRSEYALKKFLADGGEAPAGQPSIADLDGLASRIAETHSKLAALPVDERFIAQVAARQEQRKAHLSSWDPRDVADVASDRVSTQSRDNSADALRTERRNSELQRNENEKELEQAGVVSVPTAQDPIEGSGEEAKSQQNAQAGNNKDHSEAPSGASIAEDGTVPQERNMPDAEGSDPGLADAERAAGVGELSSEGSGIAADGTVGDDATTNADVDAAMRRFLLENELAELEQLAGAEPDPSRKEELQVRIGDVRQRIEEADARVAEAIARQEALYEEVLWEPVDLDRVPMVFNRDTKEEELIGKLFPEYYDHKTRLESIPDADQRADGMHGLELMLADSLRSEMARQLLVLDLDPGQADRILPRVERLRGIRESHIREGERYIQERQEELLAVGSAPDPAYGRQMARMEQVVRSPSADLPPADPLTDRYIHMHNDPLMVYHSEIRHRSKDVSEAINRKESDLARMDVLTMKIDSATAVLSDTKRGREHDRSRKHIDRLLDERLIIRTELGQRSAYITKEESRVLADSLRTLERAVVTLGLPPSEPVLLMGQEARANAQKKFDQAAQIRKRGDRTQDIIVRDSLYRHAYATELEALREQDKAITIHKYILGEGFTRGENLAFETLAGRVLDIGAPVIVQAGPGTPGQGPMGEGMAGDGADTLASNDPLNEQARIDPVRMEEKDPLQASASADRIRQARESAERVVQENEARLPAHARLPARSYERFLVNEAPARDPRTIQPVEDPELLRKLIETTLEEAATLDRRAMETEAKATAMADSSAAMSAKKDRENMELLAMRTREVADSLRTASLLKTQEARTLEQQERDALQHEQVRRRLIKYYYLDPEEQQLVLQEQDHSRYFQAKARALEQYDAAREAEAAALSNKELGQALKEQAQLTEQEAGEGRIPAVEAAERSRILMDRADLLLARGDSLLEVSARLKGAAALNESQAEVMLKRMEPELSGTLTALEMRTRRIGERPDDVQALTDVQTPASPTPATTAEDRSLPTSAEDTTAITQAGVRGTENRASTDGKDASVLLSSIPALDPPVVEPAFTAPAADRSFTIPKRLVADIFELRPENERKPQPILMNEAQPEGIIYKVQVGAFRNPIPNEVFSDMTPVMGEDAGNGLTRYTAGLFTNFDQAFLAKDMVRERGYRDAFVVAYLNGQRIPLGEAMRMTRESAGASVAQQNNSSGQDGTRSGNADISLQREGSSTTDTSADKTSQSTATNVVRTEPRTDQRDLVPDEAPITTTDEPVADDVGSTGTRTDPERGVSGTGATPPIAGVEPQGTVEVQTSQPDGRRADEVAATEPRTSSTVNTPTESIITSAEQPVTSQPLTPAEEVEQVLSSYPKSPEEIIAQFTPSAATSNYYPETGAAPARPVEMIMGLFYTVQVGVYTNPVALDKLFNITPLVSELTETGKIRYSTGLFLNIDGARERRLEIVELGVRDAFVTAYLNGKRIPVRDATILLEEHGPSILARP